MILMIRTFIRYTKCCRICIELKRRDTIPTEFVILETIAPKITETCFSCL